MKNKFLLAFLCLGLLTLNFSCQKEDSIIEEFNDTELGIINVDASKALSEILENTVNQRSLNHIFNDIDIDNHAKKITYENGQTSYTFKLRIDNVGFRSENFSYTAENLNIRLNEDGSYTSRILKYTPEISWFNRSNRSIDDYSGEIELLSIDRESIWKITLSDGEFIENTRSNNTASRDINSCDTFITYDYYNCTGPDSPIEFCEDIVINISTSCGGAPPSDDIPTGGDDEPDNGQDNGGGDGDGSVEAVPILDSCLETGTCVDDVERNNLIQRLVGRLNRTQINWINSPINIQEVIAINDLLDQITTLNQDEYTDLALDYIEVTILSQNNNQLPAMQRLITFMRQYGEPEHEIIADYYDSIIEEFDTMTNSERQFIHGQLVEIKNDLLWAYVNAVFGTIVSDLVIPVVTYALFEASAGLAIKLIQKIPLPAVLVGSRLNKMVQRIAQLGVQGNQAHVKIITTSTPISKARELFITLTKNAVSVTEVAPGVTRATMGNGNFITYRTVSSTNFPVTIDLNFPALFGSTPRVLKFALP